MAGSGFSELKEKIVESFFYIYRYLYLLNI